jgi:hypothetical protein
MTVEETGMTFSPSARSLGDGSFDEILERFVGGDPFGGRGRSRPVERVDPARRRSQQVRITDDADA